MKIKISYIWIIVWVIVFIVNQQIDCKELLSNQGFNIIGNQYYRFLTGLFLHVNWFHLLINTISLYWIVSFLNGQISTGKLLIVSVLSGILTNIIFSIIYPDNISVGGSPIIFSLFGLMCILQLLHKDAPKFCLGTWYGNWTVGYVILANIPIFSKNFSTLLIHIIAVCVALILGYIGIKINIL